MKKQITMTLTMLCLIVTLAVTSAKAQSRSHFMRINIPFEFIIGGKTLPPGSYIVKRAADKTETLLVSSTDGGPGVYILTKNVQARTSQSGSKLVFQQYGDQYFLSQVWKAGENVGRQLFESRGERTARELAKDTLKRQTVTLIAQR